MNSITRLYYFIGPFTQTLSRAQSVEFTTPIGVMAYYTIIAPLRVQNNLMSIMDPLSSNVWICLAICIPLYIGAMISMNYIYSGTTNWETAASSIMRAALSERKWQNKSCTKQLYQKILMIIWGLMMVVLINAYKDNLIAIITKPTMSTQFENADDLLAQNKIRWKTSHGLFPSYARSRDPGTTLRKIIDQAITSSTMSRDTCDSIVKEFGYSIAIICDVSTASSVIANDFSKTGTCNYYLTKDKILAIDSALAFPVSIGESYGIN